MMGITRQLYVAETDAEAEKRGRPAFDTWFASFAKLWQSFGANPIRYPDTFDAAQGRCDHDRLARDRARPRSPEQHEGFGLQLLGLAAWPTVI